MTLRFRLALLFTVLVSIILTGFSALVQWRVVTERERAFDNLLANRALTTAILILEEDEIDSARYYAVNHEFTIAKLPEEYTAVVRPDNSILFFSDSNDLKHRTSFTPEPGAMQQAHERGVMYRSQGKRRMLYMAYDDNKQQFIVIASASDEQGAKILADLQQSFLIGIVGSLVVVFAVGWFFARRMLAPVDTMIHHAEEISAQDLHKQLPENKNNDEISRLAHAFNGMFSRLERAFQAQHQFIAHASHELRTPLTATEGELEVALLDETLPDEAQKSLREALENTKHLRDMVNDLLLLARAESGTVALSMEQCSFELLLFESLEHVQKSFPDHLYSVHIADGYYRTDSQEQLFAVYGNTELLRVAVVNILENACKYSQSGTLVKVSLDTDTHTIRLIVEDNGIGIIPDEQEQVFNTFFRSTRTQETYGTGIGLALVKTIIEQHNGSVTLLSILEQGTTITLSIPRHLQTSTDQ